METNQKEVWRCIYCGKLFQTEELIKEHLWEKHHKPRVDYAANSLKLSPAKHKWEIYVPQYWKAKKE